MTSDQHNRYVAYSFLAYAGFQAFWLLIMILWFYVIFGVLPDRPGNPGFPPQMIVLMIGFMSVFFIFLTLPAVIGKALYFAAASEPGNVDRSLTNV